MIDFEEVFSSITGSNYGNQKKLSADSPIGVYYGISGDGYLRLSFMSSINPPALKSTKILKISQFQESSKVYWTNFELASIDAKRVFYSFCSSIIDAVSGKSSEINALNALKERYAKWKALFKNEIRHKTPSEIIQGLFGELYFLKKYMFNNYDVVTAINSWSGPDNKSKDFSINTDWFEIKTIGANSQTVKISSLAQLSSDYVGKLAIIRVEAMSDEFNNGESSIEQILDSILLEINDDELKNAFISKFSSFDIEASDDILTKKFDVKSMNFYKVDDSFPKITDKTVPFNEIVDVIYQISVSAINPFMEE